MFKHLNKYDISHLQNYINMPAEQQDGKYKHFVPIVLAHNVPLYPTLSINPTTSPQLDFIHVVVSKPALDYMNYQIIITNLQNLRTCNILLLFTHRDES